MDNTTYNHYMEMPLEELKKLDGEIFETLEPLEENIYILNIEWLGKSGRNGRCNFDWYDVKLTDNTHIDIYTI